MTAFIHGDTNLGFRECTILVKLVIVHLIDALPFLHVCG